MVRCNNIFNKQTYYDNLMIQKSLFVYQNVIKHDLVKQRN